MIKVEISQKTLTKSYPYLGQSSITGSIVLFCAPSKGTCLNPGSGGHKVGEYSTSWTEDNFRLVEGKVELSNE